MFRKRRLLLLFFLTAGFAASVFAYDHRRGIKQRAHSVYTTLKAQIRADSLRLLTDFACRKALPVADASIREASGLTPSVANAGCFYTHNDSGNENLVYLIGPAGINRAVLQLGDHANTDWEDIASGPGPDAKKNYVYVADIGDNGSSRASVFVYRFPDEKIAAGKTPLKRSIEPEKLEIKYPDGAHNAETLLLDPATKDLYIVTKEKSRGGLYRVRYPQKTGSVNSADKTGTVPVDLATGGAISADGKQILVKDYLNIYYWKKDDKMSMAATMVKPRLRVAYNGEMQGEAVCWLPGGKGYATISESPLKQPVFIFFYGKEPASK